ncbi:hypothetical protein FACS1894168_3390 [Deltaproteobacteria bacterium]|nr:hypothetical protein FACS1894168_3390 [Deltaproteobacteria bacterium]
MMREHIYITAIVILLSVCLGLAAALGVYATRAYLLEKEKEHVEWRLLKSYQPVKGESSRQHARRLQIAGVEIK